MAEQHDDATRNEAARKHEDATRNKREQDEATKKRRAEESKAREKEHAEQHDAAAGIKPTPTQAENDLAASGVHVVDKEPDGSAEQSPTGTPLSGQTAREVKPAANNPGYSTRTVRP